DSEVTSKVKRSPKTDFSTPAPAKLMVLWAPGYEGSGAVLVGSGSQVGLGSVLGLPSSLASSIAVTGRQNWQVYLASNRAIVLSARLMFSRANRRALRASPR